MGHNVVLELLRFPLNVYITRSLVAKYIPATLDAHVPKFISPSPFSTARSPKILPRLCGLTIQPQSYKRQPTSHCDPNTADPWICTTDHKTPRPLIVREMPHRHRPLLFHIGVEGPPILDEEVEDTVLIW